MSPRPATLGRRTLPNTLLTGGVVTVVVPPVAGVTSTGALFGSSTSAGGNTLGTRHIFPGERVTSAFDVRDASGGAEEGDRSSPFAVASDGRTVTTSTWSSIFSAAHYVQFDMNAPLAGGLAGSAGLLQFRFASASVGATVCAYFEVRSISSGSLLATYGNAATPAQCVTGTTLTSTVTSVPVVDGSDLANDPRIRVLGSDSGGDAMVIDEARFAGATPYSAFTLYPVRLHPRSGWQRRQRAVGAPGTVGSADSAHQVDRVAPDRHLPAGQVG
jgi:hypothetical protein